MSKHYKPVKHHCAVCSEHPVTQRGAICPACYLANSREYLDSRQRNHTKNEEPGH